MGRACRREVSCLKTLFSLLCSMYYCGSVVVLFCACLANAQETAQQNQQGQAQGQQQQGGYSGLPSAGYPMLPPEYWMIAPSHPQSAGQHTSGGGVTNQYTPTVPVATTGGMGSNEMIMMMMMIQQNQMEQQMLMPLMLMMNGGMGGGAVGMGGNDMMLFYLMMMMNDDKADSNDSSK